MWAIIWVITALFWAYVAPPLIATILPASIDQVTRVMCYFIWIYWGKMMSGKKIKEILYLKDLRNINKSWCDEKGWWIKCNKECASCTTPEAKFRVSKATATLMIVLYCISFVVVVAICSYIILTGKTGW